MIFGEEVRNAPDERPLLLRCRGASARVKAPSELVRAFLIRHLAELSTRYRGLDIDLGVDLRHVSLERLP